MTMNMRHSLVVKEIAFTHVFFFFFFATLWLPPSGFEVSPPSPRLAPPTTVAHELLINLGDRKYITVLRCALTCLFCEGSLLLPKGSAFACRSVNIILNVKIAENRGITCHPSVQGRWIPSHQQLSVITLCSHFVGDYPTRLRPVLLLLLVKCHLDRHTGVTSHPPEQQDPCVPPRHVQMDPSARVLFP